MTSRSAAQGSQTIKYDPERRPVRVETAGQTASTARFSYDADGTRRKRLDADGTVHYVSPQYERNVGNGADIGEAITKYYRALGRLVAFRRGGTLRWVGTDHLGSTARVADSSFAALGQMRHYPFGASRDAESAVITDRLFTGQEEGDVGYDEFGNPEDVCTSITVPSNKDDSGHSLVEGFPGEP